MVRVDGSIVCLGHGALGMGWGIGIAVGPGETHVVVLVEFVEVG